MNIGLYASLAAGCPAGVSYDLSWKLKGGGRGNGLERSVVCTPTIGYRDYFKLDAVSGEWQDCAWVRKGLPMDGELELKWTVYKVY